MWSILRQQNFRSTISRAQEKLERKEYGGFEAQVLRPVVFWWFIYPSESPPESSRVDYLCFSCFRFTSHLKSHGRSGLHVGAQVFYQCVHFDDPRSTVYILSSSRQSASDGNRSLRRHVFLPKCRIICLSVEENVSSTWFNFSTRSHKEKAHLPEFHSIYWGLDWAPTSLP